MTKTRVFELCKQKLPANHLRMKALVGITYIIRHSKDKLRAGMETVLTKAPIISMISITNHTFRISKIDSLTQRRLL